jgi:hypothetical protein
MVPEVFVMCDGANDSHGKLNILGAFDMIVSEEFPFVHPHCTLAMRLRYDRAEKQEHRIRLVIQDSSGEAALASIDTTLTHGDSANATATANLIVNINSIRFEKPGDYSIILQIDDLPAAITPLYIRTTHTASVH